MFLTWPTHTNVSVSKAVINSWLELYQKLNHYSWAIVLKEIGEPIRSTAAVKQDYDTKMVHIGYFIGRNWWHKGYASEALNRLVEFFFDEVGVHRIESRHDPRNPNSGKVMLKAGLQFEGMYSVRRRRSASVISAFSEYRRGVNLIGQLSWFAVQCGIICFKMIRILTCFFKVSCEPFE